MRPREGTVHSEREFPLSSEEARTHHVHRHNAGGRSALQDRLARMSPAPAQEAQEAGARWKLLEGVSDHFQPGPYTCRTEHAQTQCSLLTATGPVTETPGVTTQTSLPRITALLSRAGRHRTKDEIRTRSYT